MLMKIAPIFCEELTKEGKPRIKHAEPLVVARQILRFGSHGLAQPVADFWAVDRVVVDPIFVPRVVGRVDVDALHLPGVIRQKCLERQQVVALHQEFPLPGSPTDNSLSHLRRWYGTSRWWFSTAFFPIQSSVGIRLGPPSSSAVQTQEFTASRAASTASSNAGGDAFCFWGR